MDQRRILFLVAAAGLLAAAPTAAKTLDQTPSFSAAPLPPVGAHTNAIQLSFRSNSSSDDLTTIFVKTRAIVTVEVAEPSEVTLVGQGQSQPAEPGTAAIFDLLPERPQKLDVAVKPVNGPLRIVGGLLVAPTP